MVGRYTVDVCYGGDNIPFSPFPVKAVQYGDAIKCLAKGSGLGPRVRVGTENMATVDCSQSGNGKVTAMVLGPHQEIMECEVFENTDSTYDVFYTAIESGEHMVALRYGGQHIKNSPYQVVAEKASVTGTLYPPNDLRPYELSVPIMSPGEVTGMVKMPSGKSCPPEITDNNDNTCTVKYQPKEQGLHEMSIFQNGAHIPGSPLNFYVDAYEPGYVTAFGPGLSFGAVNEDCPFTIVTEKAGAGNLALSCEGPSKADFQCTDNKDGTCSVSYLPTAPGDYKIIVKFDDQHISGSPFTAHITKPNPTSACYGSLSEVPLRINETDLMSLTCVLRSPSGREEAATLRTLSNGNVGIVFTPKEVGEHLIIVKKRGKQVQNSPFRVMVNQSEVGNASKVKVYGQGIGNSVKTMEEAEFFVDTKHAGYGGLALSIEGPSKVI
jgi:filamin